MNELKKELNQILRTFGWNPIVGIEEYGKQELLNTISADIGMSEEFIENLARIQAKITKI